MAKISKGHFHCLGCGSLFEAKVVSAENQFCSNCGKRPTGKKTSAPAASPSAYTPSFNDIMQQQGDRSKRIIRKPQTQKAIFAILLIWLVMMVATVWVVKVFSEDKVVKDTDELAEQEQLELQKKENLRFVQESAPACEKVILEFMKADSAAAKAQYVYRGRELISEISQYYVKNPTFSSTRSFVKVASANLLENTKFPTITTFCVNGDKETFEVNFIKFKEEWLIDWQSLVKYDSRSWVLFTSEDANEEGEFRLFMRVRDSNKELNTDVINVVFYKPEIYLKGEYQPIQSTAVSVPSKSEAGEKILKIIERKNEKTDRFGNYVSQIDPPGYHRVRVRLKLHKKDQEHSFELLAILADHWYGDEILER